MPTAASRSAGPAFSALAALAGVVAGGLRPPTCASAAGLLWLLAVVLLLTAVAARPPWRAGGWVAPALLGYALLLLAAQPSAREDGDATAAVLWSAAWLVPVVAGGVALPRAEQWSAAAACWGLVLGVSMAASCTVWHPSACVGIFKLVWD